MQKVTDVDSPLPKEMEEHHYPILFRVEESHWWYVGRRRIIESFMTRICRELQTAEPRILDVGCGTGANLKMLAAFGAAGLGLGALRRWRRGRRGVQAGPETETAEMLKL